jgi:hypothetical protein
MTITAAVKAPVSHVRQLFIMHDARGEQRLRTIDEYFQTSEVAARAALVLLCGTDLLAEVGAL